MILSPTAENFADLQPASAYTVLLPDVSISLEPAKTISSTKTISGGAAVSVFEANIEGQQYEISLTLDRTKYLLLKKMKDTLVDEWLWRVQGKRFVVVYDLVAASRLPIAAEKWRCTISLIIKQEVR